MECGCSWRTSWYSNSSKCTLISNAEDSPHFTSRTWLWHNSSSISTSNSHWRLLLRLNSRFWYLSFSTLLWPLLSSFSSSGTQLSCTRPFRRITVGASVYAITSDSWIIIARLPMSAVFITLVSSRTSDSRFLKCNQLNFV